MSRSKWKGPHLKKKMEVERNFIKNTLSGYSRSCTILPFFIGRTFEIHNGKRFITIKVTTSMIGHKFGEFVITRKSHRYKKA